MNDAAAVDELACSFPLPPELRDARPRYAAAIIALVEKLAPDAAPRLRTVAAGFLARFFELGPDLLVLVGMMYQRERSIDRRPALSELATVCGLNSKQAAKTRLALAVARCPEIRALFPRTAMTFPPCLERQLSAALAAGAHFPGVLERSPSGALRSPVGPHRGTATIPPPGPRTRRN